MSSFDATENKFRFGMTFQTRADKYTALLILERGLQSLGDVGPEACAILAAVRSAIPTQEFTAEATDIMQPVSLTGKIERRLRDVGIEATVWCPQASHGAYVFQAINGGKTHLALDKIGALLSADPELGPIVCSRSGPQGQHLTLRLTVNGGE
jgi:hypothetical protein